MQTISNYLYIVFGALLLVCVSMPLSAHAFFADPEWSETNMFVASSLGIDAQVLDEDDDYREVRVIADEHEDTEYLLTRTANGSFCGNANVQIKQNGTEVYNGALASFASTTATTLDSGSDDTWTFNFSPMDGNGDAGECVVVWSYNANQMGFAHGNAFFDTEIDEHTLSGTALGVVPIAPIGPLPTANVVLNEVYPNEDNTLSAPNDQEWIELYNGTGAPIDIEGWQFGEFAGSSAVETVHTISASNTCSSGSKVGYARPYGGASTSIPAGGYVVIEFCAANRLNNNGDTINLYNTSSTVVDTYTYPATAKGKSNARIPDGGAWVDPIPTPGAPNTPEPAFSFASEQSPATEEHVPEDGEPEDDEESEEESEVVMQDAEGKPEEEEVELKEDVTNE